MYIMYIVSHDVLLAESINSVSKTDCGINEPTTYQLNHSKSRRYYTQSRVNEANTRPSTTWNSYFIGDTVRVLVNG